MSSNAAIVSSRAISRSQRLAGIKFLFWLVISGIELSVPTWSAAQIARSWNSDSGSWSNPINWLPNGVPGSSDGAFIGNLVGVENDTVFLDQDDAVAQVRITDGMSLQSQGNTLLVNGDTLISGSNTVEVPDFGTVIHDSRITLIRGTNLDDYDTDNLTITEGGRAQLIDGAILEVDDLLSVDGESSIRGEGIIRLPGGGTVYENSGILDPGSDGMTINAAGGNLNLDGDGGGRLFVSGGQSDGSAFANLTINAQALTDSFSGELRIGANNFLAMNLTSPWTMDSQSELRVTGCCVNPGPALFTGADLTLGGSVEMSGGDAEAQFNVNVTFAPTVDVSMSPGDRLRITGAADVEGGEYTIGDNSVVEFDGPTIIRGGTFTSLTNNPGFDTSVLLNGETTYRGDVSFTGNTRQIGNAIVAEASVINAEVFDMDGADAEGAATWDINAAATINADRIEGGIGSNPPFNGTINVSGALFARLTIDLTDHNEAWVMNGTMNLAGSFIGNATKLAGTPVEMRGTLNANSRVGISADAHFTSGSSLNLANSTTFLRFSGNSRIESGTTITGDGTLDNNGTLSLDPGLTTGSANLINRGTLNLGEALGVVSVAEFENEQDAIFGVDIGRSSITTDSDVLTVSSGSATLAGFVQPRIVNIGPVFEIPMIGDEFTILAAVGGLNGAFDEVLDSLLGGQTFEWSITHNPNSVVIELAAIAGIPGDYNGNGIVDAPDYAIWANSLGSMTNLAADGDQNGVVELADYDFWNARIGNTAGTGSNSNTISEPAGCWLIASLLTGIGFRRGSL